MKRSERKKDLGVIIDAQLKFHSQCSVVVNKANRLLGLIKKSFLNITTDMFTSLYKALVRPVLEYGNLIWAPHYKTDINKLENIQQKATRMVQLLKHLDYEGRLRALHLPTLQYSRYRHNITAVFNIIHT